MLSQRRIRRFLKFLLSIALQFQGYVYSHRYLISGIFLPWYVWSLLFYPEPVLWWMVTALSFIFVSASFIHPRGIIYWIIPSIFLFNNIRIFNLPWPYIKISYICALSICFAASFGIYNKRNSEKDETVFSTDFQLFFISLFIAAVLGVISQFIPGHPASIEEFIKQFRVIPFISQEDNFVSMRFLWLWCCGITLYWAMFKIIKSVKDIKIVLWCLQWFSLPVSLFGIYSYLTRSYMVDFYIYERRICSTFSSPAVLADLFTVVIIIGVYLFRYSKSWLLKSILTVLLIFQFITILLSGCRANIIILILFGIVWFLIYAIKNIINRNWKTIGILFVVISTLIVSVFELPKIDFIKQTPLVERISFWKNAIARKRNLSNTLFEGRKWHWECGLKMVGNSPLWGIGCGLFEQEYSRFKVKSDMFNIARTHNVPLRILAEGGITTFSLFIIFIILTFVRLSRSFFRKANEYANEYSIYLQMISVGFLALFLLSLFSDIILVREECVFFIAVLSACAARAYSKFPDYSENRFLLFQKAWRKIERRMQRTFRLIGWGYFGKVQLSKMLKFIAIGLLFILFILGLSDANNRRWAKLKAGNLSYGFYNKAPGGIAKHRWRSMGYRTLTETKVYKDAFYFGYRAVNDKMAVLGLKLKLYINGVITATLPLNSTKERWICCDMSGVKEQYIKIEFKTDKVFVPLKEHWFADSYSYGAVITKPSWININSQYPDKIKKSIWIMKWSEAEIHGK